MRKYRVLIIRLILFVVCFVIVDFFIGYVMSSLREKGIKKNPQAIALKEAYCIEGVKSDIVIIGSSSASHHYISKMLQDSLKMSVYNCAQDGSFFLSQNILINMMLERYSPKVILWEIGETALSNATNGNLDYQSIDAFYPYYDNVYVRKIVQSKDKYQTIRMLSHAYRYNSDLLTYCNLCFANRNDKNLGYVPIKVGTVFPSKGNEDCVAKIDEAKVEMFTNTINKCRSCGTQVVLTSSPRFKEKSSLEVCDSYKYLCDMIHDFRIPYLNYYSCPPFDSDSTFFKDVNHMNEKGAEKYMQLFIPDFKRIIQQ